MVANVLGHVFYTNLWKLQKVFIWYEHGPLLLKN